MPIFPYYHEHVEDTCNCIQYPNHLKIKTTLRDNHENILYPETTEDQVIGLEDKIQKVIEEKDHKTLTITQGNKILGSYNTKEDVNIDIPESSNNNEKNDYYFTVFEGYNNPTITNNNIIKFYKEVYPVITFDETKFNISNTNSKYFEISINDTSMF